MSAITGSSTRTLVAVTVSAAADVGTVSGGVVLEMAIPELINGSLLIAVVVRDTAVVCSSAAWTQVVSGVGSGGFLLDAWVHPVNGLQGTSVSFLSTIEQEIQGGLLVTTDIPFTSPVEDFATAAYTNDSTPGSPSAISDSESNILLCVWSSTGTIDLTPPSGFTTVDSYTSAAVSARSLLIATQIGGDVGAATSSPASTGRAWTLVLNYQEPDVLTATRESIRDRMITLITAIEPTVRSDVKFRHSQDEGSADFATWAEANPAGALRRFQVRFDGAMNPPEVSSELESQVEATAIVTVAYPHTAAAGSQWGRDRDDAIEGDWLKIDKLIGLYGRGNFSGTNSCTPFGATQRVEHGETCDFLVVEARIMFYVDVSA